MGSKRIPRPRLLMMKQRVQELVEDEIGGTGERPPPVATVLSAMNLQIT
jgi:hypothetical protein